MKSRLMALVACFGMALASTAAADINSVSYIGELRDSSGAPISGNATITVEVFDAATGGTSLQSQTFGDVAVNNGVFSVVLQQEAFLGQQAPFLEFTVDGETLAPRLEVFAQPFASRSKVADLAQAVVSVAGFESQDLVDLVVGNEGKINTNISFNTFQQGLIQANEDATSTNTGAIATNTGAIDTNTGAIATNTGAIATNTGAIAAVDAKATNNHNDIDTNTGAIATNAQAIAAVDAKATNNHNDIDTNTGAIATNTGTIATNAATANVLTTLIVDLQSQVQSLQDQIDGLANGGGAVVPAVLGLTNSPTNGKPEITNPQGGLLAGVEAINQLCKTTFTSEPTAHVCTENDLYEALIAGNISSSVGGVKGYILGNVTDGFTYDGSVNNNCLNFNYNSGHVATATTAIFTLNALGSFPQGNGGNTKAVPIFNIQQDQGCGDSRPTLCCR